MNILVYAYRISPTKGSESAVAWNYVTRMSKYNNLTVLYGVSGKDLGDCTEINNYVKLNPIPNVTFIQVKPTKKVLRLNYLNSHNKLMFTSHFAYKEWQKLAFAKAKKLCEENKYDLIHFVGPIGFREPGYLWKIDLPYMWGPIGGTNITNPVLLKHSPILTKTKYILRNIITVAQLRCNKQVRSAINRTDLLLTATTENQNNFLKYFNKQSIYLPENSIECDIRIDEKKFLSYSKINIIFIGSIIERKGLHILLESISKINNKDRMHLNVVGDGPSRKRLEKLAVKLSVDNCVTWHGNLERKEALKLFDASHLMVITSLSEANTTIVWEAMSHGVPTISLDHCGMHDTVNDKWGIKIPIQSYDQVLSDLTKALDYIVDNPNKLKEMSYNALEVAKDYTWNKREKILLDCYDKTIKNFELTRNRYQ